MSTWAAIKIGDDVFMATCHADALNYALEQLARDPVNRAKLSDDLDNERVQWSFGYADPIELPFALHPQRGINFYPLSERSNADRVERYVAPVLASGVLDSEHTAEIKRTWQFYGRKAHFRNSGDRYRIHKPIAVPVLRTFEAVPSNSVVRSYYEFEYQERVYERHWQYRITCEGVTVVDWRNCK